MDTPPWEAVADRTALPLEALEFLFDPAPIRVSTELAAYARAAFPAGRPLLDAVLALMQPEVHHGMEGGIVHGHRGRKYFSPWLFYESRDLRVW